MTPPSPQQPAEPLALVVGEALIDVVHRADGSVDEHPGGSPANVALTLGRLDRRAQLLAWIGTDSYGDRIRSWLSGSHVEARARQRRCGVHVDRHSPPRCRRWCNV